MEGGRKKFAPADVYVVVKSRRCKNAGTATPAVTRASSCTKRTSPPRSAEPLYATSALVLVSLRLQLTVIDPATGTK